VDSVIFGHGERTMTLIRGTPLEPADPYSGGDFGVELRAPGLSATRQVFVFGWSHVGGFFSDLAQSWRGWAGAKSWTSPEHDLSMRATHESGGRVVIEILLRDGPVHSWSVSMAVEVEPGEEMARLARDVVALIPAASA
jgi:hypothetical protein